MTRVGGGTKTVTSKSLTEQLDDAALRGVVDFGGAKIAEDASVEDKITIKNLDLGDKTLTVYHSGVVLENVSNATVIVVNGDVSLKNCTNIKKLEVQKTASDAVVIDASKIETIEINKDGIRIILKDEATEIKEVVVSAKETSVEVEPAKDAEEKAPAIEQLTVTEKADNVSISGGTIGTVTVEKAENASESETPTITLTGDTSIETIEGTESVSVAEGVNAELPENVESIRVEVISVEFCDLYNNNIKRVYTVGDKELDLTNITVRNFYSNGSVKDVALTEDNCTVTGFDTSVPGKIKVTITYENKISDEFSITVRKPDPIITSGTERDYIDAAIEILSVKGSTPNFELALSYFKKAYEIKKTDETALYYALAEVASISTDESMAKLFRENFGMKNYPATMGAFFSEEWMKEYIETTPFEAAEVEKSATGFYVRGKLKNSNNNSNSLLSFNNIYSLSNGEWIKNLTYRQYNIGDIEFCDDGDILFSCDFYGINPELAMKEEETFFAENQAYRYSVTKEKIIQISDSEIYGRNYERFTPAPEFKVIDKDNEDYQSTLYNSMQTVDTVSYLLVMNFFNCNANGFNLLVDNILNVFGTRYENAKKLVSNIEQENIVVPAEIITALKLNDVFGENTVKIGKAEVDVFFAATDLIKAVFQYVSAYDLSLDVDILPEKISDYKKGEGRITNNLNKLKSAYNYPDELYNNWFQATRQYFEKQTPAYHTWYVSSSGPNGYSYEESGYDSYEVEYCNRENAKQTRRVSEILRLITNKNTLKMRNEAALKASKATIINSLNTVMESYDFITGEESTTYPSFIKDMIKQNGEPFYALAGMFVEALDKGDVFTFPAGLLGENDISIDLGVLFTPNFWENFFNKDSNGNLQVYVNQYDVEAWIPNENAEGSYYLGIKTVTLEDPVEYTSDDALKAIVSPEYDREIKSAVFYGYTTINTKYCGVLVPSLKDVPDVLPKVNLDFFRKAYKVV